MPDNDSLKLEEGGAKGKAVQTISPTTFSNIQFAESLPKTPLSFEQLLYVVRDPSLVARLCDRYIRSPRQRVTTAVFDRYLSPQDVDILFQTTSAVCVEADKLFDLYSRENGKNIHKLNPELTVEILGVGYQSNAVSYPNHSIPMSDLFRVRNVSITDEVEGVSSIVTPNFERPNGEQDFQAMKLLANALGVTFLTYYLNYGDSALVPQWSGFVTPDSLDQSSVVRLRQVMGKYDYWNRE